MLNIKVGNTYKIDVGELGLGLYFELIKITKICQDHIECYRLEYPSEPIGVKIKDLIYVKPLKKR